MTAFVFAVAVALVAAAVGVVVALELVAERRERARRRAEFERWERVLGPIMKQWEDELRADGLEVPPPIRRLG